MRVDLCPSVTVCMCVRERAIVKWLFRNVGTYDNLNVFLMALFSGIVKVGSRRRSMTSNIKLNRNFVDKEEEGSKRRIERWNEETCVHMKDIESKNKPGKRDRKKRWIVC